MRLKHEGFVITRQKLCAGVTALMLTGSMVFGTAGTAFAADGAAGSVVATVGAIKDTLPAVSGGSEEMAKTAAVAGSQEEVQEVENENENLDAAAKGLSEYISAKVAAEESIVSVGESPSGEWSIGSAQENGFYASVFGDTGLTMYTITKPTGTTTLSDTVDGEKVSTNGLTTTSDNGTVGSDGKIRTDSSLGKANHMKYVSAGKGSLAFYFKDTKSAKVFAVNKLENNGDKTVLGYFTLSDINAGESANSADISTLGCVTAFKGKDQKLMKVVFPMEKNSTYLMALGGSNIVAGGITESLAAVLTGNITLSGNVLPEGWGLRFTNTKNGNVTEAEIDKTKLTYTAELEDGEYKASLINATGFSVSDTTRILTFSSTSTIHNIGVVASPQYTLSGKLTSSDDLASYAHKDDVVITFTPEDTDTFETVTATYNKDTLSYEATLTCESSYTLTLAGAWDYKLEGITEVKETESTSPQTRDLSLVKRPVYSVTGGFIGLTQIRGKYEDLNVTPTAISFTDVDSSHKNYVYPGSTDNGSYSVSLKDGSYVAAITLDGYSTTTHVVVKGGAVTRDLLLRDESAPEVPYSEILRVGSKEEYKTVQAAVDAVSRMKRTYEDKDKLIHYKRVTILVSPGTYREQVIINSPDITLESASGNKNNTKITWYYGIGYSYFSAVNESFGGRTLTMYSPYADYDQFERGNVINNWGACVVTTKNATGFKARNITFENSFNKYMTDEEIADGVEFSGLESISVVRSKETPVTSKAATERAAAFMNYADQVEYMGCSFISSQDTIYTGNGNFDIYYRNCYIEGSTDFICGEGNVLFDACEMNICGYLEKKSPAYITANSASAASREAGTKGYIFRSCFVSASDTLMVSKENYLGRMWGKYCTVTYLNTQFQSPNLIATAGWSEMSGNKPTDNTVKLSEYNSTYLGESIIPTTGRVEGTVKSSVTPSDYSIASVYTNGWTPSFAVIDSEAVPTIKAEPTFTSNGDINIPNPGETITVNYTFGSDGLDSSDASEICWYALNTDFDGSSLEKMLESATLLRVASGGTGRSIKIPMSCAGKYLGVVITPVTTWGARGAVKAYHVNRGDKPVSDTWVDPSDPGSIDPGSGINIYLAGDSTVKDYSATGMYNSGTARKEGAWGEFLQCFFDSSRVTVIDYAEGGRASRSFITEGKLASILNSIKEGDYLFIQFGHNDSSNQSGYLDRFVPLYTAATKSQTETGAGGQPESGFPTIKPDGAIDGSQQYAWDCGATYKGFLQVYVDEALARGATPVIVTPVARMSYTDGKIRPHHDATDSSSDAKDFRTENNAYVTACRELYDENKDKGVLLLDAYTITETLFNDAYTACNGDTYGKAIMNSGEATHSNKTGGMIQAAYIAKWIQEQNISISRYVKKAVSASGINPDGKHTFDVDEEGRFTARDSNYTEQPYWSEIGQTVMDTVAAKAEELGPRTITIEASDKGTARANGQKDKTTAYPGTSVMLSAEPKEGYVLDYWNVYTDSGSVEVKGNTFIMPGENVTVEASYRDVPQYDITVVQPEKGGTIAANKDKAYPGTAVDLTAIPDEGFEFKEWIVTSGNQVIDVDNNRFIMVEGVVTVKGSFVRTGGGSGDVTPSEVTLVVGETLAAVPDLPNAGESEDIVWSVDKDGKKCVKVSNGVITANKVTTKPAEVTASTASGAKWTTKVTVIDPQTDEKTKEKFAVQTSSAAKISAPKQLKLQFGAGAKDNAKKKTVSVKASGKDLKNGTVSFNKLLDENGNEIENGETVMVTGPDNKGKYTVESKAPGIAYIKWTASVDKDGLKGDVLASFITKVIVTQPVYDIKVFLSGNEPTSLTLNIGQSLKFDAAVDSPTDSGKITWSVKGAKPNAGAARITKSGRLTATKAGQVTLQAKCGRGFNRTTITLNVTDPGKYVIINKDQYAVKSGKKSAVTLSGKAMEGGKAQKADAIAWSITDKDGNAVTGITKDTKPNKFNISADVPAGVYLIHASIAGSEESTAELIVK